MKQSKLEPFCVGGFMEAWLSFLEEVSPDVVREHLNECKILGAMMINTLTKARTNILPIKYGNMMILLTGPPGSAKSWLTDIIGTLLPKIASGTPEFVAQEIAEKRWGLVSVNEGGEIVRNANRQGYMDAWGYLLNKLYMLESIEMGRRKKSKSVVVERGSYYVSVLMNALPEDLAGIFNLWRGLERRFLTLRFSALEPKVWIPTDRGADKYSRLAEYVSCLENVSAVVDLRPFVDAINNEASKLKGPLRRQAMEYAVKLLVATVIDHYSSTIMRNREQFWKYCRTTTSGINDSKGHEIKGVILSYDNVVPIGEQGGDNIIKYNDILLYDNITNIRDSVLSLMSPDVVDVPTTLRIIYDLLDRLASYNTDLMVTVSFDPRLAPRVSKLLEYLRENRSDTLRNLMWKGPLQGLDRRTIMERILDPLETAGFIEVDQIPNPRGKPTVVVRLPGSQPREEPAIEYHPLFFKRIEMTKKLHPEIWQKVKENGLDSIKLGEVRCGMCALFGDKCPNKHAVLYGPWDPTANWCTDFEPLGLLEGPPKAEEEEL